MSETTLQHWVYEGFCVLSDGKKGHQFHTLGNPEERHIYAAAGKGWNRAFTIGAVYDADATDTGIRGTPRYNRMVPDRDAIVQWHTRHKAVQGHFGRLALEKKEGRRCAIDEALAPIRKELRATNPAGRAAIVAYVVSRLMNPHGE